MHQREMHPSGWAPFCGFEVGLHNCVCVYKLKSVETHSLWKAPGFFNPRAYQVRNRFLKPLLFKCSLYRLHRGVSRARREL
jgi:hypothetical protein